MKKFLKRKFCKHTTEFPYTRSFDFGRIKIRLYICPRCGKTKIKFV